MFASCVWIIDNKLLDNNRYVRDIVNKLEKIGINC